LVSQVFNPRDYTKPHLDALTPTLDRICSSESQPLSICSTALMLLDSDIFKYGHREKERYFRSRDWEEKPLAKTKPDIKDWLRDSLSAEYRFNEPNYACNSLPNHLTHEAMDHILHDISYRLKNITFRK